MSSSYFHQLDAEARSRYRAKLFFGNEERPDPLHDDVVRFAFTSGPKNLPPVTAGDIYVYLVEGVCFYTKEQFKCHKSGDAYNDVNERQRERTEVVQGGQVRRGRRSRCGDSGCEPSTFEGVQRMVCRERQRKRGMRPLHLHGRVSR
ncbi:hypothetical protein HPB48_001634 [Haemaphysalis longicornis]|uniref:Uncharacterized protein n=1 Tax=Haemaphysalis longicornis TaxID=44386 RepID=A0A9J6FMT6_HAELO|nr:hypothetical protein HPB48_001634 [Haemaphysalis longicornis]